MTSLPAHRRSQARQIAMRSLFAMLFASADLEDTLAYVGEEERASADVLKLSRELASGAYLHRIEIDECIKGHLRKWDLSRLGNVEKSILRIAVFELLFCPKIPPRVTINEAVEMGKEFATHRSVRFINGVLDSIARQVPEKAARMGTRAAPISEHPAPPV